MRFQSWLVGLALACLAVGGMAAPRIAQADPVPVAAQFLGVTSDGRAWHTIRTPDGWLPFGDVKQQTGDPGDLIDANCSLVNGELHVCAVTSDGGMWHTIRHVDGSWASFGDVKKQAGDPGPFTAVACSGDGGQLQVAGVTAGGQLWHTIRRADGSWQSFGDVKKQSGDPGPMVDVACSTDEGRLHVCGGRAMVGYGTRSATSMALGSPSGMSRRRPAIRGLFSV